MGVLCREHGSPNTQKIQRGEREKKKTDDQHTYKLQPSFPTTRIAYKAAAPYPWMPHIRGAGQKMKWAGSRGFIWGEGGEYVPRHILNSHACMQGAISAWNMVHCAVPLSRSNANM